MKLSNITNVMLIFSGFFLLTNCTKAPKLPELKTSKVELTSVLCEADLEEKEKQVTVRLEKIADAKLKYTFNCETGEVSAIDFSDVETYAKGKSMNKIFEPKKSLKGFSRGKKPTVRNNFRPDSNTKVDDFTPDLVAEDFELKLEVIPLDTFESPNKIIPRGKAPMKEKESSVVYAIYFEDLNLSIRTSQLKYTLKLESLLVSKIKDRDSDSNKIYEIETNYSFLDYKVIKVRAESPKTSSSQKEDE